MKLHEEIAVSAETVGARLSDAAIAMMVAELERLDRADVSAALSRARKEMHGRLSLADILDRLPNQHPGPEEAWSMIAPVLTDQTKSLMWTQEMAKAYEAADDLKGDEVAARMAFREVYSRLVGESRAAGKRPDWNLCAGWASEGRKECVRRAVSEGKLTVSEARRLLPECTFVDDTRALT
jgi:hypothetical protein